MLPLQLVAPPTVPPLSSAVCVRIPQAMPAVEREEQYGAFLKSIGTIYFGPDFSNGQAQAGHDLYIG